MLIGCPAPDLLCSCVIWSRVLEFMLCTVLWLGHILLITNYKVRDRPYDRQARTRLHFTQLRSSRHSLTTAPLALGLIRRDHFIHRNAHSDPFIQTNFVSSISIHRQVVLFIPPSSLDNNLKLLVRVTSRYASSRFTVLAA